MSPTKPGSKTTSRKINEPASRTSTAAGKTKTTYPKSTSQTTTSTKSTTPARSSSRMKDLQQTGNNRSKTSSNTSYREDRNDFERNRSGYQQDYNRRYEYGEDRTGRNERYADHRNPYAENEFRQQDSRYTGTSYNNPSNRHQAWSHGNTNQNFYQDGYDGRFQNQNTRYQNDGYQNEKEQRTYQQPDRRHSWPKNQVQSRRTYPSGENEEGLRKLLLAQLKDMYWAEKTLTKALPKMIKNASSDELREGIEEHLEVTHEQVAKLEEVFAALGVKATAKKCEAMEGLIKEAEEIVSEMEEGPVRDAGIICAAQKVEHYEIATYGCLATYAEMLDEQEAAAILHEILGEEKEADEKLTDAAGTINWEAIEEGEEEEEDEEEVEEDEDEDENLEMEGKGKQTSSVTAKPSQKQMTKTAPKGTSKIKM